MIKKIFFIVSCCLAISSCNTDENNVDKNDIERFEIEKLFEIDSISVYRFLDKGRYVYFTNRKGNVYHETIHSACSNKHRITQKEHHETLCD